jgi:hypothetical protein
MCNYQKMRVVDLKKICKERKIAGYSKLKKAELVALLNRKDEEKIKHTSIKHEKQIKQQEAPLPTCLDKSKDEEMENMFKSKQIEKKEDEVLSDLDDFIDNYNKEEERLKKEEEERRKEEEERLRKEEEERIKEEEERLRKEEEERRKEEERLKKEEEMKKEMLKKLEELKRQEEEKMKKQQIQNELAKFNTEDIVVFLKSQGYTVFQQKKAKYINKKQTEILKNTINDLDLLSDDEE